MLRVGIIGDIVGKSARTLISQLLPQIRNEHRLDFVVANTENASHGFGLSINNANELFASGIDVMTGGNHSFDKKEIHALLQAQNMVLRPHNYSPILPGSGLFVGELRGEKIAVLNLMGHFAMPQCQNVFLCAKDTIRDLQDKGVQNILIDMHAEATSEKRTLFEMLKGKVSAICGTHTHIGTDDLMIEEGSFYVSDVGMCGGFDSVIGMESEAPIARGLTGIGNLRFEVSKSEKVILQMIVLEILQGKVKEAYKIRYIQTIGWLPKLESVKIS